MFVWLKAKLFTVIIAVVAATTIAGTATVIAAKSHAGPFAATSARNGDEHHGGSTTTSGDDNGAHDQNEDQKLLGVISSFDLTAKTVTFLPDNATTPLTISFDGNTTIESEVNDTHGTAALQSGQHALIEFITRADNTLYATEIKVGATTVTGDDHGNQGDDGGDDHGGGQGGDDHGGDDHHHGSTPTPTP